LDGDEVCFLPIYICLSVSLCLRERVKFFFYNKINFVYNGEEYKGLNELKICLKYLIDFNNLKNIKANTVNLILPIKILLAKKYN
jgi:hypothetical protein